ncbi:MAG: tRNA (N6-threonylcarbamoyladenosine(37)-N6)-methyltransferase TrmO [Thermodesulfobacteriota bacterium]
MSRAMAAELKIFPVGKIQKKSDGVFIYIYRKYQKALAGLEQFSHIHVLYWFDRNDTKKIRSILQVHPCNNKSNPLTGVFATHSPKRPNLIALSRCRILSISGTLIRIDDIDAFHGSPVIDIKSYFPYSEAESHVCTPKWERKKKESNGD